MKEYKRCFTDKIEYQNQIIDKVAEQFIHKANVREVLLEGSKARGRVIANSHLPKTM